MFGFLKNKSSVPTPDKPSLTDKDKDWVEQNMLWLIECFGMEKQEQQPFLLPTYEQFPYKNLKDEEQFTKFFQQLCEYWQLNEEEIKVIVFDDLRSMQWNDLSPLGAIRDEPGTAHLEFTREKQRFILRIAKSNFDDSVLLTAILASNLARIKLLNGYYMEDIHPDLSPRAELFAIFYSFGIFIGNSCELNNGLWTGRTGYLTNDTIGYANALLCYITGKDAAYYREYFNSNTNKIFAQAYDWLKRTNDTLLTREVVENARQDYLTYKAISNGFKEKNYDKVIEAAHQHLQRHPGDSDLFNNIGYAYLMQKKYKEAIQKFTEAISIDPYYDYALNNRGYCRLQINDLENAFADLYTSYEMNPLNSFSCRNLGAYYLKTGGYKKALEYFERSIELDPRTELIHFYLACTYRKLNNEEKALEHITKSRELEEHNDSLFVFE